MTRQPLGDLLKAASILARVQLSGQTVVESGSGLSPADGAMVARKCERT